MDRLKEAGIIKWLVVQYLLNPTKPSMLSEIILRLQMFTDSYKPPIADTHNGDDILDEEFYQAQVDNLSGEY